MPYNGKRGPRSLICKKCGGERVLYGGQFNCRKCVNAYMRKWSKERKRGTIACSRCGGPKKPTKKPWCRACYHVFNYHLDQKPEGKCMKERGLCMLLGQTE